MFLFELGQQMIASNIILNMLSSSIFIRYLMQKFSKILAKIILDDDVIYFLNSFPCRFATRPTEIYNICNESLLPRRNFQNFYKTQSIFAQECDYSLDDLTT